MENQIQVLKNGVEFLVDTSDRARQETIHIRFCHKDDYSNFVHGVTSEGIMQMLISRHIHLLERDKSVENKRILLFLNQALDSMKMRKAIKLLNQDERKRYGVPVQAGSQQGGQ